MGALAGQFVQQWKLRMRAQEATLKEVAKSKLRRLLARKATHSCTEIDVGDIVLFYKAQDRGSLRRRRGPAKVLEMDESGVAMSFQSQTFKVARYFVRRRLLQEGVRTYRRDSLPS